MSGPNGGALASAEAPEHPGTGSAVLGFVQWARERWWGVALDDAP